MRLAIAVTLAVTLTGCSTSLPSMHTEGPMAGRCYTTTYIPLLDLGAYTIAEAMDGWKCAGLADGSMPRTGTKEDYVAAQRAEIKAIMEAREQAKK